MSQVQWKIDTKIGPIFLVTSEKGLKNLTWKQQLAPFAKTLDDSAPEVEILAEASKQIQEYLNGSRTHFDVPLDPDGTDFQKSVWNTLSKIPFGKTKSYKEIALELNNQKAVRAVGTANGKNPLCIIIPCHRVINSSGDLGGYSGGLSVKALLLDLEQGASRSKVLG